MNAWERQHALARTTIVWAAGSVAVGGLLATRRDPWLRACGQQHVGWGAADLGIVAVLNVVQARRRSRMAHPDGPQVLDREQRRLRRVLWINVAADAGYLLGGIALWRTSKPEASGAGAAIALQGAFLMLHDGYHALGCGS